MEMSVRIFGAVGDGIADDTAAINAAILNARHFNGGYGAAVYFPAGTYKITSPINLLISVSLYGDGSLASRIMAVDTDAIVMTFETQQANPVIRGLFLDGIGQTAARKGIYVHGSLTDHTGKLYGFTAIDNSIWNFDAGIVLNNVQDFFLLNNVIQNVNQGVQLLGATYTGRLNSNKIVYQSGAPFVSGPTQAVYIGPYTYSGTAVVAAPEGPIISDNQILGFQYGINAVSAVWVVVKGNGIDGTLVAMSFQSVRNGFEVTDNYIELNGPLATVGLQATGAGAAPAVGNVNIERNTFIATETTSVIAGIRINGLGFVNPQANVNIVRNYFLALAGTDIILVQPSNINVENNTSDSTATTHSLSIDTRVAGIINVTKNKFSKDISVATASDISNGYIRILANVTNGTTLGDAWIDDVAWITYTPAVTSQDGTPRLVSAAGRYKRIGKTVHVNVNVSIATHDTATGEVRVALPVSSVGGRAYTGSTVEYALTGISGANFTDGVNTGRLGTKKYDGTTFWVDGYALAISLTYEVP